MADHADDDGLPAAMKEVGGFTVSCCAQLENEVSQCRRQKVLGLGGLGLKGFRVGDSVST